MSFWKTKKWLVIGEDSRLKELATMLRSPSRTVFYKRTTVWNEELNKLVLEFQPNKIILPILPLKNRSGTAIWYITG
ncbi:hypothetical protein OL548_12895 [Lysinibacillus sp. MHQ-1]|nr:hypothetical protein OL548_12895 [Lysinibacillus sp. MHQ-1]